MYDTFQDYLDRKILLSNEEKELIRCVVILKKLRKRQYLLQEGAMWKYSAFITKGCMRTYAVDDKGIEHIIYFGIENWWIGDRECLLDQTPSRLNIDAIEDSEEVLFTNPNFKMISSKIPVFKDMILRLFRKASMSTKTVSYPASANYRR